LVICYWNTLQSKKLLLELWYSFFFVLSSLIICFLFPCFYLYFLKHLLCTFNLYFNSQVSWCTTHPFLSILTALCTVHKTVWFKITILLVAIISSLMKLDCSCQSVVSFLSLQVNLCRKLFWLAGISWSLSWSCFTIYFLHLPCLHALL